MTNVPAASFGPTGFIAPSQQEILAGVILDFQAAFGGNLNLDITKPSTLATPQGQLASSMAALIGQTNDNFLYQSTQTDPAYAVGRWQDAIARIYFLERLPAQSTVVQCTCTGLDGVIIPVGALAQDEAGNIYSCTEQGAIVSGTVSLPFANNLPGPTPCPTSTLNVIVKAVFGWNTINNPSDGVIGNDVETPAEFEIRRQATVQGNSFGAIGSIIGAVAKVPGVLDYYGIDNPANTTLTIGGVTIPANSIYIAVVGGLAASVAQAILSKKAPGCAYYGNTTVTVYDSNPLYTAPIPYTVKFDIPVDLPILYAITIANTPAVPSNAVTLIQNAIVNAFGGGFWTSSSPITAMSGPRARIGSIIYATSYIPALAALGSWALVTSIAIGSTNTHASVFVGSISGFTLTVASTSSGSVASGQVITDTTGNIIEGTTILSGSGSTWTINISQTVVSETMTGVVVDLAQLPVNINQEPTISAANIAVTIG